MKAEALPKDEFIVLVIAANSDRGRVLSREGTGYDSLCKSLSGAGLLHFRGVTDLGSKAYVLTEAGRVVVDDAAKANA